MSSDNNTSNLRNVVIIGGYGGALTARALAASVPQDVRLILIEKNGYAFYPPAALRAAVIPGAEDNALTELDGFFPAGSKHVVLKSTAVTALHEKSVTIAGEFEGSNTIPFEYAILATGATYAHPSRPGSADREEVLKGLRAVQADVKQAKSILIVGGGPVGVEFAGEVKSVHPDKKITLVSRPAGLIDGFNPNLGKRLHNTLNKSGVDVRLGVSLDHLPQDLPTSKLLSEPRTFSFSDGSSVEADFVLVASGGKPNTSLVKDSGFASALDQSGRVKVDPKTLRVLDSNLGFYFAVGDCSDAPGSKTAVCTQFQAPVAASGVQQLLAGKGKSGKTYKEPPRILLVSYGPRDGQGVMFNWNVGSWITTAMKSKTLFVPDFKKLYKA